MITCKKAGPLMEKEEFEKLPFLKKVGLKMHLIWCKLCNGYRKDSSKLNQIIKSASAENSSSSLSESEKSEMKSKLIQ